MVHQSSDLSPAQLEIFLDQAIHRPLPLYNIGGYTVLRESVDTAAFAAAYQHETERFDAFRLRFPEVDGVPRQCADAPLPALAMHDFSAHAEPEAQARAWAEAQMQRSFRLGEEALHASALVKVSEREYWYCAVAHHLIIDGWGFGLWVRHLVAAYLARCGRAAPPQGTAPSFLQSLERKLPARTRAASPGGDGRAASPGGDVPALPALLEPRLADGRPQRSVRVVRSVSPQRLQALVLLAGEHGYQVHHLLLALLFAYFAAVKRRDQWVVGLPSHNRRAAEKAVIGSYAGVGACVLARPDGGGIAALMAMVKQAMARSVRGQDASGRGARGRRRFDIEFNYLRLDYHTDAGQLQTETQYLPNGWTQTPLSFNVCEFGSHQALQFQVDVNEAYCSRLDAELLLDRLDHVADQFMHEPGLDLRGLDLVPPAERLRLTHDWGRAVPAGPGEADIADRLAAVCARNAEAVALRTPHESITHAQLQSRARGLAAWLHARSDDAAAPLAICMASSPAAIVAMLAALMLRRPYVPLDPGSPPEWLGRILGDAGPEWVLTDAAGRKAVGALAGRRLDLDDAQLLAHLAQAPDTGPPAGPAVPAPRRLAERSAWVIYTSGSTGTPKGVVVPQSALLRLACAPNFMPLGPDTVTLQAASLAFDASTFEIWATLLNGGTLVLHGLPALDLDSLTLCVQEHRVNTLWLTAGLFDKWVARLDSVPESLRVVLAGGDVVPPAAVHKLLQMKPDLRFVNGYGPTENGVFSACAVVAGPADPTQPVPIGKPVNGSSAYVVDAQGRLLPAGEPGELWVGGDGLAIGYLNQDELTRQQFLVPAVDIAERIYKTGDRVRWRDDGQLEYLGRIDQQVKIRGFRVELEHIENVLRGHPGVAQAAVVAVGMSAAEKFLRACVRPHHAAQQPGLAAQLLRHLRQALPQHMVPAQLLLVDAIPLSANGKVDRQQLRQLTPVEHPCDTPAVAGEIEREVWCAWQAVLPAQPDGPDDDFFDRGGQSLAAMQIAADLGDRFGIPLSIVDVLKHPTIRQQAAHVQARLAAQPVRWEPMRRRAPMDDVPMSSVQEQMWLSHRLNGGSHEYNVPGVFELAGELDREALQAALRRLIARHQPLACCVLPQGEGAVLRGLDAAVFRLGHRDLGTLDEPSRCAAVAEAMRDERLRSFVLEQELPIRARVLTLAPGRQLLLITLHHMAVDGASLANFHAELAALYRECRGGEPAPLPELAFRYQDFVLHQRDQMARGAFAAAEAHWRRHLEGAPAVHELPLDRPRPETPSRRGRVLHGLLEQQAASAVAQLAAAEGMSLFTLLQTAFAVLVGEFGQCRDVLVGTPVNGRPGRALRPNIGCFINTLVLRTRYGAEATLRDVAAAGHRQWSEHLAYHQVPYARVLEAVAPAQSRSANPLFQLWFVLHAQDPGGLALEGLSVQRLRDDEAATKFDLMVSATPGPQGLRIEWLYAEDLFDARSMARLLDGYLSLLQHLPALMDTSVPELPQRLSLAAAPAATPLLQPCDAAESIAGKVFQHAAAVPDAPALRDGRQTWSYGQLAQKVRRLCGLLAESGVRAGDRVAVCADRSAGGVVALLAAQALGAAYVPVDARLPAERLAFVLDDAGVGMVLGHAALLHRLPTGQRDVVLLDGLSEAGWLAEYDWQPGLVAGADAVAYLIYTSGTSGMPKGVCITRGNLAHYVAAMSQRHDLRGCRHYAVNSAFHTDLGNTTLYLGLWHGACLHLMDSELMLDGAAVSRYVHEHAIDVMKITPGHFAALCDDALYPPPLPRRWLIFGGEVLRGELLQSIRAACLARGCTVVNHYGPTEATIGGVTHTIDLDRIAPVAPLGLPLPGVQAQVVAGGVAVPRGAWGELVLGGPTVGLGYHRRDDLNARAFHAAPDAAGVPVRHYRTGDRVRLNADGRIEFGGRFDDQVKLRGFRIELAEIDSCLLRVPGIRQAVTLLHKDEARQDALASFVVAAGFDAAATLAALRRSLPDYMLPGRIVALDQIPWLGNGKPDRRALAARLELQAADASQRPATPTESTLHAITCELLRRDRLPVEQRFFDAGGNSLMVTRLANELQRRLGLQIPVQVLMENHSIRSLADLVDALCAAARPQPVHAGMVEIEV
jgi:amino acid adenylation domain-containing protein